MSPEVTREVSDPLAAILDRYLPERAKTVVETGLDPFAVIAGLWHIAEHCKTNERAIIASFHTSRSPIPNAAPHAAPPRGEEVDIDVTALILERQEQEMMLDDEEAAPV